MNTFGCGGVELRSRQNGKRKRFSAGPDECVPAKRHLTEESMATFMHQLNLSTTVPSSLPLSTTGPLNITAVTTCPSASSTFTAETTCSSDEVLTRGTSPSSQSSLHHHDSPPVVQQARLLTPPATAEVTSRQRLPGSSITESLDLASQRSPSQHPVHIRVTPATPPSSESSGSLSQEEDYEPMEQSSLLPRRAGRGVVLEDLSSDSSDSEMPSRVWIAPELKSLAASHRHLLPPPVLNEIAKVELAVVPWVSREQCLARFLAKSKKMDRSDSSSSEEEVEGAIWNSSMHFD